MLRVAAIVEQNWHAVPGGTATSTNAQLLALTELPNPPEIVGVAARHRGAAPSEFSAGVPVRQMRLTRRALYASWLTLRRPAVQSVTGTIDVIHATSAAIPPRSAPMVVTVHDLAFLHFPDHATRLGQRFFERSWAIAKREADLVLCPSEATAMDCVANGLEADRIRVIPWGVDPQLSAQQEIDRIHAHFDLPTEFLLFVGTVEPRKNLRRIVAAVAKLGSNAPPLVVVGPAGWGDDIASITSPLGDRARLLGRVAQDDLGALYAAATVFVWPSLLEGFGLPVLEAMVQGTAVVTSIGTSTEELCGGVGVCVDPTDTKAITDAIGGLLADEGERERLGAMARQRALRFTWEQTATATMSAYRELSP